MLYMPPETLRRKWYYKAGLTHEAESVPLVPHELLPKVDVYSYGLIKWEIFTQTEVFLEYNEIEEFCSAICDKDARPKVDKVAAAVADIMSKCWAKNPQARPDFRELVPQLETARIKIFLDYKSEVAFWQSYFPTKYKVPFNDFVKTLWRHTAKVNKKPERSCSFETSLSKLIAEDSKSEVSLESYSKLIAWFGPLNERVYFEDFCNIMQNENASWFFPHIRDSVEAEGLMSHARDGPGKGQGIFLVRLTAKVTERSLGDRKNSPFTISFIDTTGIAHIRIPRTAEGYTFTWKEKTFKSETLTCLISTLGENLPQVFAQPLTTMESRYITEQNK